MDYLYKLSVKVIFQNNFQVDLDKIFQLKGIFLDAEEKIIASSNWTESKTFMRLIYEYFIFACFRTV